MLRVLSSLCFLGLSACQASTDRAVGECMASLRETLVAPSTLNVVWSGHADAGPITKAEVLQKVQETVAADEAKFDQLSTLDRISLSDKKKWLADPARVYTGYDAKRMSRSRIVLIEYEADNRFGSPLRSYYTCRLIASAGPSGKPALFRSGPAPAEEAEKIKRMIAK